MTDITDGRRMVPGDLWHRESTPVEKNWLQAVLDDAAAKVAAWPEWKREAYKLETQRRRP